VREERSSPSRRIVSARRCVGGRFLPGHRTPHRRAGDPRRDGGRWSKGDGCPALAHAARVSGPGDGHDRRFRHALPARRVSQIHLQRRPFRPRGLCREGSGLAVMSKPDLNRYMARGPGSARFVRGRHRMNLPPLLHETRRVSSSHFPTGVSAPTPSAHPRRSSCKRISISSRRMFTPYHVSPPWTR
jgi:hypothetical protein